MREEIYISGNRDLTYVRGYVYSLQYHIVWCTKYRRKVLTGGAEDDCKALLRSLADEYRFQIPAMEVMPDHIHLLVDVTPQFNIPDMIRIMKGMTAPSPGDEEAAVGRASVESVILHRYGE